MLDNTVTLPVDLLNSGVTTNQVYTRHEEFANRSKYISPAHSLGLRDTLDMYRTFPNKTKTFNGVAKSGFKFTTDIEVPGADSTTSVVAPEIAEVSFSLPVGFTTVQLLILRQRIIALLDNDSIMNRLNERLEV